MFKLIFGVLVIILSIVFIAVLIPVTYLQVRT